MFDHFVFGAQAQTHLLQQDERTASPTDTTAISTQEAPTSHRRLDSLSSPGMSDILSRFTNQTLVPNENDSAQSSGGTDLMLDPDDEDTYMLDTEYSYRSAHRGLRTVKASSSAESSTRGIDSRRLKRQLNTQLQSCSNHVKDIGSLVQDMMSENPQYVVHPSPSIPTSAPPVVAAEPPPAAPIVEPPNDEGFCEIDADEAHEVLIQQELPEEYDDPTAILRQACAPNRIRELGGIRYVHGIALKGYYGGGATPAGSSSAATAMEGVSNYIPRENGKGKIERAIKVRVRQDYKNAKIKAARRKRDGQTSTNSSLFF